MVITKARRYVESILIPPAKFLAKCGVRPNYISAIGLCLAIMVPIFITPTTSGCLLALLLIAISSFMDLMDGMVARISGLKTAFGSFIDSVFDRVSDFAYMVALMRLGIDPLLVVIVLALSYLISYERAKAESLGIAIEGIGLAERGERIILIALSIALWIIVREYAYIPVAILMILSLITVVQRFYFVYKSLVK